uniref:Glucuronosyltransferase n=1 Tax=Angiostrongylus cantonensis TaxID=6313 RepID=A0A0K0DNR1_ANGCA
MKQLLWQFLFFGVSLDAGKILVYSPSYSYSHLISNGRIADTLVNAGHDVVMFIPEYLASTSKFDGTKHAKVVRMNNINPLVQKTQLELLDVEPRVLIRNHEPVAFLRFSFVGAASLQHLVVLQ